MGSSAEIMEPTTETKKHHEIELEDDEVVVDDPLIKKTSLFPNEKVPLSTYTSITTTASPANTSSSSILSGDLHHGEEEHTEPEETEIGFHEEHEDGKNGNVYFDGDQGSEVADAETDALDSQTADTFNGEENQPESGNGLSSEGNKGSPEIEEVKNGDLPRELDVVNQSTGDVIEEELGIEDVEDYDVEKVLDSQETHDLYCPNCNSCITKRVVLKRRKRRIPHVLEDPKRVRGPPRIDPLCSEDNSPSGNAGENSVCQPFVFKCLSCFSIFIPTGVGVKLFPPSKGDERFKTEVNPQQDATGNSNWFTSLFGFNKQGTVVQQGGTTSTAPETNLCDNLRASEEGMGGSTANEPSKAPVLDQGGETTLNQDGSEISASQDETPAQCAETSIGNRPLNTRYPDVPLNQDTDSHDTKKILDNGKIVADPPKFPVPYSVEQSHPKIDKEDYSEAYKNQMSDSGHLSPIPPSTDINILNIVTTGPDGIKVETVFPKPGTSQLFEGTDTSDTTKIDSGPTKVTEDKVVNAGSTSTGMGSSEIGVDIPPFTSLVGETVREPLLTPLVEGRKLEILKSIVYGGLIESITSLGVISSAAGSGASTLNILVLGLANLIGGLILIVHNLQELREERSRITTEDDHINGEEEDRYKRVLGRRENFTLHALVAILSFIIVGLIPPVVYTFSFRQAHNKVYKVTSVLASSLLCIILLAIAKAHVKTPRSSHLKSVIYYATIGVSVSGISFLVGDFLDQFLEKHGWSDGSATPTKQMMLALMGRKAGFAYSSSY